MLQIMKQSQDSDGQHSSITPGIHLNIPVIDFARWTSSTSTTEQVKLAQELVRGCQEVGFVYVINHGIPEKRLQNAFEVSRKLFELSHNDKMKAPHPDGSSVHRGYSFPGLEKVSQVNGTNGDDSKAEQDVRSIPDCKESYEVGSEQNSSQPNVWLPEDVLPGFREFTTSFYAQCHEVAQSLIRALTMGLGIDDTNFLTKFHTDKYNQLRLLHYPPVLAAAVEKKEVVRMPAHSDWGSVTMLFQDDCGGLEIEDPHTPGKFVAATPMKGALVMNIGDLLMRWSNDSLKSTLHRVNLPPLADRFEGEQRMTRSRYSIVYFTGPTLDTIVECLPTCTSESNPPKYEPVQWLEYMMMRAKLQYESKPASVVA